MSNDTRTVTDLETTALRGHVGSCRVYYSEETCTCGWEAAVRELARRAEQGAPNDCDIYIARAEAAEAVVRERDRYREALEQIGGSDPEGMDGWHFVGDEHEPDDCPGCVARAALATPDTPPDA
jgi:hypothetical protein